MASEQKAQIPLKRQGSINSGAGFFPPQTLQANTKHLELLDNDEIQYNSSHLEQGKTTQQIQEQKQFQQTYFTLREFKPELFSQDNWVSQYIKVDGQIEQLTPDMENFTLLHKDLDTIGGNNNQMSTAIQTTVLQNNTQLKTTLKPGFNKIDDLILANKGVWDSWWTEKLQANQNFISQAKVGNYEGVAKAIDFNYNNDQEIASINYQEPETGYSALHYAVSTRKYQIVNFLLMNNIDTKLPDAQGQTALHLSCKLGDFESYKQIVEHNYTVKNCVDKSGKQALSYAIEARHNKIIEFDKNHTITLYAKNSKEIKNKLKPEDFEFIMPLGRGAFGEVVLVQHESKYFAMKILKKRKYNGMINFVLTEKEVARKVRHKFIVRLAYAFQTFDHLYMITEYCGGGDLRALVSMKKKLNESDARMYLAEILVAIEELHKNGIIHRDIKLDNILLDKDGHAKLTDFGLSKEGMFEQKLTNTMLGGGRSYQIPEVLKEDPYEKSVDLYLFGLLAYEIMTGKAAFPAELPSPDLENNIMNSKYREPLELTSDARDLIAKLIVSNPEKRLTIAKAKRHQFFNTKAATIDWKAVSEGQLKMPLIKPRPIIKSALPFKYGEDSDDGDNDYYRRDNQSSEGEAYVNNDDEDDGLPQMQEVQVNGSPQVPKQLAEERKESDDFDFEEDSKQKNWIPNTIDVGTHIREASKAGAPDELFMTDTNILAMRVPNFSYAGDIDQIKHQ